MLRLAFDFIITWRETRTRPNAYYFTSDTQCQSHWGIIRLYGKNQCHSEKEKTRSKSKYINWLLITIVAVLLGSMVVELVQNV